MLTVAYHTLGCKVNQYETEKIRGALEMAGFKTVPFGSPADACIINTCSVTQIADSKSRAAVRRGIRANPSAFVVITGCYAELEPVPVSRIEGVDLVVPNEEKENIPQLIMTHCSARAIHPPQKTQHSTLNTQHCPRLRTRVVVKVQDGCDHFCAYCVIPYARPHMISRPIEEVLAEFRMLAEFGYREIVLTGIRLGSYDGCSGGLPELISRAVEIDGIERIRLSSVEPWEVDDALLDAMAHPRVCRHLHIPLQSGDNSVLHRMNRPYTAGDYRRLIAKIRERIPDIGVTTDVICGFPGEDEAAFENTRALIDSMGFSRLHVFRFSARSRTKAAVLPDQVDARTKKRRSESLIELGKICMGRFALSQVGKTLQVLVETAGAERVSSVACNRSVPPSVASDREAAEARPPKLLTGFADNYLEVSFPGDPSLRGRIVPVKITGIGNRQQGIGNRE